MDASSPSSNGEREAGEAGWSAHAARLAPLIDGEEYFAAVRASMIRAGHQILIVGWELHSEVALLRGKKAGRAIEQDGYPVVLTDLLQRLVDENDGLRVYLLIWSGAALFALEREHIPRMKRPWENHPRIRLKWAEDTPVLASHHQKFVVIDDRVVFVGGMDLTKSRWDSHDHRVDDPRRRKPGLVPLLSDPYHDTMVVYEGEIAGVLGQLGRERWRQATSERLEAPPATDDPGPWPPDLEPLLEDRAVRLALTQPEHNGREAVRDVEASFVEQFRSARRFIYIETQYLAASGLVGVLAERLRERDGPEIVLVLPYGCPGALQSMALDHQRDQLITELRDADPGGRLGVYWPTLAGGSRERPFETSVYVHAKVLVVDDRIFRVGSANLNNRSMGLDTELDAWVEAGPGEDHVRDAIASFRRRSLSYLLDRDEGEIRSAEREHGSLVAAIEHLRRGDRTLHPFEHAAPDYAKSVRLDIRLADPDRPLDELDAEQVIDAIASQAGLRERGHRVYNRLVGALRHNKGPVFLGASIAALAALLALPPSRALLASLDIDAAMSSVRQSPLGIAGVLVLLVVLGSVGVPITLLVTTAGAVIGSWLAVPLTLAGVTAASVAGFAFGRFVPGRVREWVLRGRMEALADRFSRNGVVAVAILRNLPIAPFAVVNAALGISGIAWTPYLLGTVIGMLPGVVLLSLFGHGLIQMVSSPTPASIFKLLAIGIGIVAVSVGAQRLLRRFSPDDLDDRQKLK